MAVGVYVPDSLDAGGEGGFGGFGDGDVGFAEGGEGAGEVGVFDCGVRSVGEGFAWWSSGWLGRVWFRAVGSLGWLMAFWPVIVEPSARPADMWWEKLEMMAGRTAVLDSSTPPIRARR